MEVEASKMEKDVEEDFGVSNRDTDRTWYWCHDFTDASKMEKDVEEEFWVFHRKVEDVEESQQRW